MTLWSGDRKGILRELYATRRLGAVRDEAWRLDEKGRLGLVAGYQKLESLGPPRTRRESPAASTRTRLATSSRLTLHRKELSKGSSSSTPPSTWRARMCRRSSAARRRPRSSSGTPSSADASLTRVKRGHRVARMPETDLRPTCDPEANWPSPRARALRPPQEHQLRHTDIGNGDRALERSYARPRCTDVRDVEASLPLGERTG
jgi:hypothetical protein